MLFQVLFWDVVPTFVVIIGLFLGLSTTLCVIFYVFFGVHYIEHFVQYIEYMQVNTCLVFEPIVTKMTTPKHSHLKDYKETMSIYGQYCKLSYPCWYIFIPDVRQKESCKNGHYTSQSKKYTVILYYYGIFQRGLFYIFKIIVIFLKRYMCSIHTSSSFLHLTQNPTPHHHPINYHNFTHNSPTITKPTSVPASTLAKKIHNN